MKDFFKLYTIVNSVMWITVSIGVCFGIHYTNNPKCLFAFLIPACCCGSLKCKTDDTSEEENNEK